jgi:hypothetical protein
MAVPLGLGVNLRNAAEEEPGCPAAAGKRKRTAAQMNHAARTIVLFPKFPLFIYISI